MFPAGFWSRERVRRFALQLEGERWASACPPLTARSRRPRTKPLATDGPPTDLDMGTFLRPWLCATAWCAPEWSHVRCVDGHRQGKALVGEKIVRPRCGRRRRRRPVTER